ncbi:hypothetical protein FCV25MIE_28920 [Fagus crenata]
MAFFAGVGLYYSTLSKCRATNPIPRLVDVHPLWFFREYSMSVELVFREAERSAAVKGGSSRCMKEMQNPWVPERHVKLRNLFLGQTEKNVMLGIGESIPVYDSNPLGWKQEILCNWFIAFNWCNASSARNQRSLRATSLSSLASSSYLESAKSLRWHRSRLRILLREQVRARP